MTLARRQPLRRKTPMKRAGKLRPMSAKKAARMPRYRMLVKQTIDEQAMRTGGCSVCRRCKCIGPVEPHHTQGRAKDNLFIFVMVCRECHDWIHSHTKQARKDGWLK